ncbi:MAG: T9SS type A sorting domain-containing protein [Saprospiraceae bacterium]|nr:T9SS type A sorting domain-containing protein [Saprospiraceae bacterium]
MELKFYFCTLFFALCKFSVFATLCDDVGQLNYDYQWTNQTLSGGTYYGNDIEISGTLTIASGNVVTFVNCNLDMTAALSQIVINQGGKLRLFNCNLFQCGSMWIGIRVQPGGLLNCYNTKIEDASQAIAAEFGSILQLNTVTLNRNNIGILIPATTPTGMGTVNLLNYSNVKIKCTSVMNNNGVSLVGIWLRSVSKIVIGVKGNPYVNEFENLKTGIDASSSNFDVYRCSFKNSGWNTTTSFTGTGIKARDCGMVKIEGLGAGGASSLTFSQNKYADVDIQRNPVSMEIFNCKSEMTTVGVAWYTAFKVSSSKSVNIHDNVIDYTDNTGWTIDTYKALIDISSCFSTDIFSIRNIEITMTTPIEHFAVKGTRAIGIISCDKLLDQNGDAINRGIVHNVTIDRSNFGKDNSCAFHVDNCHQFDFTEVHITKNNCKLYGLHLSKCSDLLVEAGDFIHEDVPSSTDGRGIEIAASSSVQLCDNEFRGDGWGLNIAGSCSESQFKDCSFGSHFTGLHYEANGYAGPHDHRGNFWRDESYSSGNLAIHEGLFTADIYKIDENDYGLNPANGHYYPVPVSPNSEQWVQPETEDLDNCLGHSGSIPQNPLGPFLDNAFQQYWSEAELRMLNTQFINIYESDSEYSNNQDLEDYYEQLLESEIDEFNDLKKLIAHIYDRPTNFDTTLNNLTYQFKEIQNEIDTLDTIIDLDDLSDSLVQVRMNYLDQMTTICLELDTVFQELDSIWYEKIIECQDINGLLDDENELASEEKEINRIYLNDLLGITRDTNDNLFLFNLSRTCTRDHGQNVYEANEMLIDSLRLENFDENECDSILTFQKENIVHEANRIQVFSNKGTILVTDSILIQTIKLIDLNGHILLEQTVNAYNDIIKMGWLSGLYILGVKSVDGSQTFKKIYID